MTNQQHPITPPPELADKWTAMLEYCDDIDIFTDVARWGADQELEACCEWIGSEGLAGYTSRELRAARRPKPPSLKAQALEILNARFDALPPIDADTIRRALESLPS